MENKIKVETGRTIIGASSSRKATEQVKISSTSMLEQMQNNFDRIEKGYNQYQTTQQNNSVLQGFNNGGLNLNSLTTLLPLLKGMNDKNNMANILEMLPKMNNQNSSNQTNLISQLLPLISSLTSKKTTAMSEETKKIDSLKKVDED